MKRYEDIGKLTTAQGENYTTGCLLGYEYVKNHQRLIALEYYLNYVEKVLIQDSTITDSVSISVFSSLNSVAVSVTTSEVELNIFAVTAGIKKYKPIIRKKKKKHDKKVLSGKYNLNTTIALTFKSLIYSYIIQNKFLSVNNVLREYY